MSYVGEDLLVPLEPLHVKSQTFSDGSRVCCYGATVAPLLTKRGPILIQKGHCKNTTQNIQERNQRNPNQLLV